MKVLLISLFSMFFCFAQAEPEPEKCIVMHLMNGKTLEVLLLGNKGNSYRYRFCNSKDRTKRDIAKSKIHKIVYPIGEVELINRKTGESHLVYYKLQLWNGKKRRDFAIGESLEYKVLGSNDWQKGELYKILKDTLIFDNRELLHQKDTVTFGQLTYLKGKPINMKSRMRWRWVGLIFSFLFAAAATGIALLTGLIGKSEESKYSWALAVALFLTFSIGVISISTKSKQKYKLHKKWIPKTQIMLQKNKA